MTALRLPAILDIRAADSLRDDLMERRGSDVVIDGSEVERLGGLCLQVLLSARKTWAEESGAFTFETVSSAMRDQLTLYGCVGLIGDQMGVVG